MNPLHCPFCYGDLEFDGMINNNTTATFVCNNGDCEEADEKVFFIDLLQDEIQW